MHALYLLVVLFVAPRPQFMIIPVPKHVTYKECMAKAQETKAHLNNRYPDTAADATCFYLTPSKGAHL